MTVDEFLECTYLTVRSLKPASTRQLRLTVKKLRQWHTKPVLITELNETLVSQFVAYHATDHAAKTTNKRRGDLLCIWRLAADMGLCDPPRPRLVRRIHQPRTIPVAFTHQELRVMLETADKIDGYYPTTGIKRSAFWRAWILVQYSTSLRTQDMLTIRLDDALRGQWTGLQEKTQVEILHRLLPEAVDAVRQIEHPPRTLLFAWDQRREQLYNHFYRFIIHPALGLPRNRKNGPQKLRRTAASYAELVCPGSATKLLGHLDPRMAALHYIDPRIAGSRPAMPPAIE